MDEGQAIQDFQMKASKEERDVFDRGVDFIGKVSSGLLVAPPEDRPALYAQARRFLDQAGVDVTEYPEEYTDEMIPVLETAVNSASAIGRSQYKDILDKNGNVIGVRDLSTNKLQMFPKPAGTNITYTKDGGFSVKMGVGVEDGTGVTAGNVPLTPTVKTKLQTTNIDLENAFARVNEISQKYGSGFLTIGGRLRHKGAQWLSYLGIGVSEGDKKFADQRQQFVLLVNREFNAYRKLITGAAASVKEIEFLKKAALDMSKDPLTFEASLKAYTDALKRGIRINRRFLREGINVQDGEIVSEEVFGELFDSAWSQGSDDDPDERMMELRDMGLEDFEIAERLTVEGYNTQFEPGGS
jgi:hypothetical protein